MTQEQQLDLYAQIITVLINRLGGHTVIDMLKELPNEDYKLMYRINEKQELEVKVEKAEIVAGGH